MAVLLGATESTNFKKQFKIYKKGITDSKITIVSKKGESFNKLAKMRMYLLLEYKVYDLNNKEIKYKDL
jgi:hypothetical protein